MTTEPNKAPRAPSYGDGFEAVRNLQRPNAGWTWFRNSTRAVADSATRSR